MKIHISQNAHVTIVSSKKGAKREACSYTQLPNPTVIIQEKKKIDTVSVYEYTCEVNTHSNGCD